MKIYTKSGDEGLTGLYGTGRVPKTSAVIEAIGEVDELNSTIGVAIAASNGSTLGSTLVSIQHWLFDLGAELASTPETEYQTTSVSTSEIESLEASIDAQMEQLPPLRAFILPGGTEFASRLHLCRAVCRRAERAVWKLNEERTLRREVVVFLNRLSDWLFAAARTANMENGSSDVVWQKKGER